MKATYDDVIKDTMKCAECHSFGVVSQQSVFSLFSGHKLIYRMI